MIQLTRLFLVIIPLFCGLSCNNNSSVDPKPTELATVSFDFESSLDQWIDLGGSGERKFDSDIIITDELSPGQNQAVKFTVTPESVVGKGNRAELTFDQQAVEGQESWYEWWFFLPDSYQDVALEDAAGAPNWQVIGQWHQQPDFARGETWDNYPDAGKSVPIAFNYYYFSQKDPSYQALLQDPQIAQLHGFNTGWDEVSAIGLSYGDPPVSIAIHQISKNTWYKLKVHIRWSEQKDGFIQAWIDEQEFTDGRYFGLNMLNSQSHYFKFGLYRNPNIPYTNSIFYDDIRIW
ncbi:MAG: heparin lyase I family protein [Candidatus Cyclobacteriaceae bacterium M3_2C_046]